MIEIVVCYATLAAVDTDVEADLTWRSAEIAGVGCNLVVISVWTLRQASVLIQIRG